jgi:hypothetical protein
MLDRRNRWEQCITLELFNGVKDIFRNHLPVEATRKQNFKLSAGAITPVSLYEFELRELFAEATVKSGCKWWKRTSDPMVGMVHFCFFAAVDSVPGTNVFVAISR